MGKMKYGMITFLESGINDESGKISHFERINNSIEEIVLADKVGLDSYGIGEHHRSDYAASTPPIILAAASKLTKNIVLSSSVTVLSSDDPIRVYEQYATLDILSNGRANVMLGRGSFVESFNLFGLDLEDYDMLFSEKLDLFLNARENENVYFSGKHRKPLNGNPVFPRAVNKLNASIAVGGSYESVKRAARLGLPIVFAILGNHPKRFKAFVDLYKKEYIKYGHDIKKMSIGAAFHAIIGNDDIIERYWPSHRDHLNQIGSERGWSKYSKQDYLESIKSGAYLVGNKDYMVDRLYDLIVSLGINNLLLHIPGSFMPHEDTMRSIKIYGNEIIPELNKKLSNNKQFSV